MFDERFTVTGDHPDFEALLDMCEPPDWHRDALCREHPEVSWFPSKPGPRAGAKAKAICGRCLARERCVAEALDDPGLVGIWGGTDERDRAKIREKRAA